MKELNAIISSSNHTSSGICISSMPDIGESIGRKSRSDEDSFRPSLNYIAINKGVKTFAFSSRGNTLVTGGIDRIVRIYNIPSRTFQITKGRGFPYFPISKVRTFSTIKLGCVVRMVVDSILSHAEFGSNDHRKDAPRLFPGHFH